MKSLKWLVLIVPILLFSVKVMAFDSMTDCNKTFKDSKVNGPLQNIFNNYTDTLKYSKILTDGTYTLCFEPTISFCSPTDAQCTSKSFTLTATADKPLLIYGLSLSASNSNTQTLLQLTGSNITLQNIILTAPSVNSPAGTAIQIGDGVNPTSQITIGASNAITNFATGINVAQNASAKILQNIFTNLTTAVHIAKDASAHIFQNTFTTVATPIAYESSSPMAISADWLGKHASETDATKVDRIVGKLDLAECKGSVEMYLKATEGYWTSIATPLEYHATCPVATVQDKSLKLIAADKSEKEIAVGACYFDCDKLDVLKDNYVSFTYTSASNHTSHFAPELPIKTGDLPDVVSAFGVPIYVPTASSGIDGADGGSVFVPSVPSSGPDLPPTVSTKEPPAKDDEQNGKSQENSNSSNTDDKVGAGASSGGCGGGQSITGVGTGLTQPLCGLLMIGGLPVVWISRRFLRRSRSSQ